MPRPLPPFAARFTASVARALDFADAAEQVRLALKSGVKLVVSSDSHSQAEVQTNLLFAVATARKGWARKGDVLNTLPPDAFVRSLRDLRRGSALA